MKGYGFQGNLVECLGGGTESAGAVETVVATCNTTVPVGTEDGGAVPDYPVADVLSIFGQCPPVELVSAVTVIVEIEHDVGAVLGVLNHIEVEVVSCD